MPRKVLELTVEIEIQAVTCPGVWLCQTGRVSLSVFTLGTSYQTCRLPPVFPLLFRDIFYFRKRLPKVCALGDLQCMLHGETIYCELVQWSSDCTCSSGRILAQYLGTLNELLFPPHMCSNEGIDLLMRTPDDFPGILSPKVEVATKIRIDEVWDPTPPTDPAITCPGADCSCNRACGKAAKRQKPVCHTPTYHKTRCIVDPQAVCYSNKSRCIVNQHIPCCSPFKANQQNVFQPCPKTPYAQSQTAAFTNNPIVNFNTRPKLRNKLNGKKSAVLPNNNKFKDYINLFGLNPQPAQVDAYFATVFNSSSTRSDSIRTDLQTSREDSPPLETERHDTNGSADINTTISSYENMENTLKSHPIYPKNFENPNELIRELKCERCVEEFQPFDEREESACPIFDELSDDEYKKIFQDDSTCRRRCRCSKPFDKLSKDPKHLSMDMSLLASDRLARRKSCQRMLCLQHNRTCADREAAKLLSPTFEMPVPEKCPKLTRIAESVPCFCHICAQYNKHFTET